MNADLSGAKLSGAKLSGADLREADLSGANFTEADLSEANLSGADLDGAKLGGAKAQVEKWSDLIWINTRAFAIRLHLRARVSVGVECWTFDAAIFLYDTRTGSGRA